MIKTQDIAKKTGLSVPTILTAIRYIFGDSRVAKGKTTEFTVVEANQVLGKLRYSGNLDLFTSTTN